METLTPFWFSSSNFTFYTVTSGELPRLLNLTILVHWQVGEDHKKMWVLLMWEKADICSQPMSLRSRQIRWRPAVTDGHLLKSRFKWGCISHWQGGECYPILKQICALFFPIHIYHIFSLCQLFLSFLLFLSFMPVPPICYLCLQLFLSSFFLSISAFSFCFSFPSQLLKKVLSD